MSKKFYCFKTKEKSAKIPLVALIGGLYKIHVMCSKLANVDAKR